MTRTQDNKNCISKTAPNKFSCTLISIDNNKIENLYFVVNCLVFQRFFPFTQGCWTMLASVGLPSGFVESIQLMRCFASLLMLA